MRSGAKLNFFLPSLYARVHKNVVYLSDAIAGVVKRTKTSSYIHRLDT